MGFVNRRCAAEWLVCSSLVIVLAAAGCSGQMEVPTDIDISNQPAEYQLGYYAAQGNVEMVKGILEAFPEMINARSGPRDWTPLHFAASSGQTAVVQHLLEAGADPAAEDQEGNTALDYANQNGHVEVGNLFLGQ